MNRFSFTSAPYRRHSKCLPIAGTSFHNPLGYWPRRRARHSPRLATCVRGWWHQTFRPWTSEWTSTWTFAAEVNHVSSKLFTAGLWHVRQYLQILTPNASTAVCWNSCQDKTNLRLPLLACPCMCVSLCLESNKWMTPWQQTPGCEEIDFSPFWQFKQEQHSNEPHKSAYGCDLPTASVATALFFKPHVHTRVWESRKSLLLL